MTINCSPACVTGTAVIHGEKLSGTGISCYQSATR